ncbi:MAG: class I SAM-dependent methyltransferase, partial [Acidobacteriota bacterium]
VLAYPNFIFPQTHPDRLSTAAKFCGMNPASPDKCRVLELGCGTGTNLNWLASNLPESEFIGIDLAENHIIEAEKTKTNLELRNISFLRTDILNLSEKDFGKFDYIIAHGLFSWVPDFVREKVLSLYDELLNPNGVGFISYNVYPGSYQRQIVRDIMHFHTQGIEDPLEKIEEGIGLIDFLSGQTTTLFKNILKHELEGLAGRQIGNIYHDEFSEVNQPFYFTEFIAEAEKHNLQFVSESEYFPHQPNNVSDEAASVFKELSRNTIQYEQYSDFVKCRRFRQTILCKKDVVLDRQLDPLKINEFYISSFLKSPSPQVDLNPDSFKQFINENNAKIDISHNLTKVVLVVLMSLGWHLNRFDELLVKANEILQAQGIIYDDLEKEVKITAFTLLQLYSPYGIGFHSTKSNAVDFISEKPFVSKFIRQQAIESDFIINFYGFKLNVQDYFLSSLLILLDGTRTRENLLDELTQIFASEEELADKDAFLAQIPEMLDRNLFILAKTGFLIG